MFLNFDFLVISLVNLFSQYKCIGYIFYVIKGSATYKLHDLQTNVEALLLERAMLPE